MIFDYLQFWFSAYNEHGTHSPFVFNLLTRGLYPVDARWKGLSRKEQFFDRLLVYFEPQQLATLGGSIPKDIKASISTVPYLGSMLDCVCNQIAFFRLVRV